MWMKPLEQEVILTYDEDSLRTTSIITKASVTTVLDT